MPNNREPINLLLAKGRKHLTQEDIQLATEVHHLEPIDVNWNRRLDITNLKGDCKAHHSAEESHHKRPGGGSKSTSGQRA